MNPTDKTGSMPQEQAVTKETQQSECKPTKPPTTLSWEEFRSMWIQKIRSKTQQS